MDNIPIAGQTEQEFSRTKEAQVSLVTHCKATGIKIESYSRDRTKAHLSAQLHKQTLPLE